MTKFFTLSTLFVLIVNFSSADEKQDPATEWLGFKYAEVVYETYKSKQPQVPLSIELNQIGIDINTGTPTELAARWQLIAQQFKWYREGPKEFNSLATTLIDSFKEQLPADLMMLITRLEGGAPLEFPGSSSLERRLKNWIEDQPEKSIYPHQLMTQALSLTNGQVLKAWALAWNVMVEGWPATTTRNYSFKMSRFASLTGERNIWNGGVAFIPLPEKEWSYQDASVDLDGQTTIVKSLKTFKAVVSKRGDEFSYIYHRIGVELLTLVIAKVAGGFILDELVGKAGAVGEWFKYRQTAGLKVENHKRVWNDLSAADSGSRLYDLVTGRRKTNFSQKELARGVSEKDYLRPNHFLFGHFYQITDGRPAVYYGSKVDSKFWEPFMSVDELEMRFVYATRFDSQIMNPLVLWASPDYERLHRGLVKYLRGPENNPKLNSAIQDYLRGARATPFVSNFQTNDADLKNSSLNAGMIASISPESSVDELEKRIRHLLVRVVAVKNLKCSSAF